ncbi:borealin-like [Uranotaenia lowii]|uniref:borealin-like n=1 Tax=Uranotaenia lowii TaxID=190385 RepID=UPI00247A803F|nr:borealin-like [Uranotaenia lowii]
MVRGKSSRNGNTKRNRTSFQEEKINVKIRELDILADSSLTRLESELTDMMDSLTQSIRTTINRIPKRILQMRMSDLRLIGVSTIEELEKLGLAETAPLDMMNSYLSQTSQFSNSFDPTAPPEKNKGKKWSKTDEGYSTEDSAISSIPSETLSLAPKQTRPYGPLASAIKNRRRSKSLVSSHTTPAKNQSTLLGIKTKKTFGNAAQSLFSENLRSSRSKHRTPNPAATASRLQTVSTDRGLSMITLKVQPNTPMAIMRRARIGESIYSVTGSPVITSVMAGDMANVNIPIADGFLSIRPTEMECVDTAMLKKIDSDTLEHLKKLQMNLNKIMEVAEAHNFQKL